MVPREKPVPPSPLRSFLFRFKLPSNVVYPVVSMNMASDSCQNEITTRNTSQQNTYNRFSTTTSPTGSLRVLGVSRTRKCGPSWFTTTSCWFLIQSRLVSMAPRDPLLSSLRVCVLNLQSGGDAVTDSNPHLPSCCELLELVLRKGLQQPVLSLVHRDYWHCFQQLPHHDTCGRLSALSLAIEQTRACRKLLSAQGRGRYFLRLALSRRTLPQFFTHLLHTPRVLEWYVPVLSILRNEEFVEPFMSLLLVLSNMEFTLNMERRKPSPAATAQTRHCYNSSASCNRGVEDDMKIWPKLTYSGILATILEALRLISTYVVLKVCEVYEAVPCRQVGMVLRYLSGRVFILDFIPGSQAHADKFISPGDIIDEINGTSLRNSKNGQAGVVLSRLRGRPLSIHVLRWRAPHQTSANLEDGEPTPAARSCFPQTAEPRTKAAIVLPVS
ncbi:uncharacterized protein si:ch211-250n8.1 [Nothobranchius furzeri]|uniref:uncharacterized protein si:ch211-250n8.1 n=1 Tax=Nothobranchius furzeri TaxID=105023 RepID=UPI0039049AE5